MSTTFKQWRNLIIYRSGDRYSCRNTEALTQPSPPPVQGSVNARIAHLLQIFCCVYSYVLAVGLILCCRCGYIRACAYEVVRACARASAAAGPAFELSLTWAERGRAAGRRGDGKAGGGGCPTNSPSSLSPFHFPPTAPNNKPFNSAIFAASHPRTLEAPTRSCCLIQCSEKNSWLESDFFFNPRPFFLSPHHSLKDALPPPCPRVYFLFFPLWHQTRFCPLKLQQMKLGKTKFEDCFWNSQGAIRAAVRYSSRKCCSQCTNIDDDGRTNSYQLIYICCDFTPCHSQEKALSPFSWLVLFSLVKNQTYAAITIIIIPMIPVQPDSLVKPTGNQFFFTEGTHRKVTHDLKITKSFKESTQSCLQDCLVGLFLFLSSAKAVIPTDNRKGLSESPVQQSLRSYRREIWLISLDRKHAFIQRACIEIEFHFGASVFRGARVHLSGHHLHSLVVHDTARII